MGMSLEKPGTYLTGLEDMAQSIALYFRTPMGSIPLHPEHGFAVFDYVDRNHKTVLKMIRGVKTGLALWDNRYTATKVKATFDKSGKMKTSVTWSPNDDLDNKVVSGFLV